VFVTCHGGKVEDSESLKGMKLDKPGFDSNVFPWDGKDKKKPGPGGIVTLDLAGTQAVQGREEVEKVALHCQAWAENIDTEPQPVDKQKETGGAAARPRGGGFTFLCFKDGKIQYYGKKCK
jgi:hypothetical protein